MKKTNYLLLSCLLMFCSSGTLFSQVIISEDFSSATGTTPPANWVNNEILTDGGVWMFDNPDDRESISPIEEPFAIFDSDYLATFGEEATLESPMFDASAYSGYIYLSFDQYFNADAGGECYVEVWDGTSWVEVYSNFTGTENPDHQTIEITNFLNGASDAQIRFHWIGNYAWWWIVDNVVVENVTCHPVYLLSASNETTTSVDLTWSLGDSETSWNIEWGPAGFTPGQGEELGSDVSATEDYQVTNLTPGTDYDFYVQADCGAEQSFWMLVSTATLCAPIQNLPWLENFDGIQSPDYGVYPNCWYSEQSYWLVDNNYNTWNTAPYSGDNFIAIYYADDDVMWTPEFELTAGNTYEFSFMWAGDGYDGWAGEVLVNTSQSSTDAESLNDFVTFADVTTTDYQKAITCFTPTTSGTYTFGLHVYSNYNPYPFLTIDDVSLVQRGESAGMGGSMDVCQTSGLVDLNEIITMDDPYGTWNFTPNPSTIVDDTLFNPLYVPAGTIEVEYVTTGCLEDVAVAEITIYGPSSAGEDGMIDACKNQLVSLYDGLSGVVIIGGDWYDPSNQLLPSSQVLTGNFPGQFNYKYIVGNDVCPDDTASVIVNVANCTGIEDQVFEDVKVYPNPSNGIVFIESAKENTTFELVITDVNGRVIPSNTTLSNGIQSVDLSAVQTGIYFFKLINQSAEKVYRVVIN